VRGKRAKLLRRAVPVIAAARRDYGLPVPPSTLEPAGPPHLKVWSVLGPDGKTHRRELLVYTFRYPKGSLAYIYKQLKRGRLDNALAGLSA